MVLTCLYRAAYIGSLGALLSIGSSLLAGPLANIALRQGARYVRGTTSYTAHSLAVAGNTPLVTSGVVLTNVPLCTLNTSAESLLVPLVSSCSVAAAGCFIGSLLYLSKNKLKSIYLAGAGVSFSLAAISSYVLLKN
jgi:hypothetical protein